MTRPRAGDTDPGPTFTGVLRHRARRHPDRTAFTFLADTPGAPEAGLTYEGLDRRARAVAARLRALDAAGRRALLLYPPGLDFLPAFFGCLAAGTVAVPAHLPRPNRPMDRLGAIADDARPAAVLTTAAQLDDAPRWAEAAPALAGVPVVATDLLADPTDQSTSDPDPARPDDLAFLQYTSGSTSAPKGVMVTHANLLANSAQIGACFGATEESRGVFWLPLFHDMGLIGGVLQTVYCGGSSTLLSPVAFLQRPVRWLEAVSRTGATISGGPDFAYDLCTRKVTAAQKAGLDLSRWTVAFNGAEPVRAETLDRFAAAFAPCGFRREAFLPCYGLAEATLLVSGRRASGGPLTVRVDGQALARGWLEPDDSGRALVASGGLPDGQDVVVVDPESGRPSPAGAVGEIWVRGPGVARGYFNRPEETAATFGATLDGDGPYLRTGDLGTFQGGQLVVTGRLKDLIIVGGRNVYPHDLEATAARCHPDLRPDSAAAFSVEGDGLERVVLVLEVERGVRGARADAAAAAVREAVAEAHDLDVHAVRLIRPMTLPRTSSGKVRRHACRDAYLAGTLEDVGGWTRGERGMAVATATAVAEPPSPAAKSPTAAEVAAWLAAKVAGPLGVPASEVDHRKPLAAYGLGSIQAVALAGELELWLGRPLPPTLAYEYPTIEALSRHLAGDEDLAADPRAVPAPAPQAPADDPVAVIGIGCRFPGASGPEAFWRLLTEGGDAVGPVPEGRWGRRPAGDPASRGGYLDAVDGFDAEFFGVAPREAVRMDPQQRLLLEVAWEALEDAGQVVERLAGGPVGVFVGVSTQDYSRLAAGGPAGPDAYEVTGNASSLAANRLSYLLDFRGPSLAVDTACSSSLVAVHLACQSLRSGECALALAGGVNLVLAPEVSERFARAGFLAPDGKCKTFAAAADGYVRGEGAGVLVLKPLSRALADGDPVYAVVRGSAVNQDGRTNGLTAPSRQAQEAVLRAAYRAAGLDPTAPAYVEAHGTGTSLGDPIEAHALGAVVGAGRPSDRPCLVGSVKTNIGHLEAAAGVAGLAKVALMLRHRAVPASLHCDEPSPHIPFDELRLRVATAPAPWPAADGPAVAGVSSFGFGGTNAHVVLAEPPATAAPATPVRTTRAVLLPLSARSPEALHDLARAVRDRLAAGADLGDVAHAAGVRRDHHDHRLAVTAVSTDEVVAALDAFLLGKDHPDLAHGRRPPGRRPGLAFVFAGQGGLWPGAGRDLLDEPEFRAVYEACDRRLGALAGRSLLAELADDATLAATLRDPEAAQTHQFALQTALAALWRSWGVTPDAVVGHSLGEVAAAAAVGALGFDDALTVATHRGRLMRSLRGRGETAAVGLPAAEVERRLGARSDRIAVAAVNAPELTAVAGDAEAVDGFVRELREAGVFARRLDVGVAFHSPQMDPLLGDLSSALAGLRPRAASAPIVSTVTAREADGASLDAAYWARNLRETVRFADAVGTLAAGPYETFLEIGPHPIHGAAVSACLADREQPCRVVGNLRRGQPGRRALLRALGQLYVEGQPVAWSRVNPPGRPVRLPSYPWRHERYWVDAAEPVASNGHVHANGNGHHATNGNGHGHANGNGHHAPRTDLDGLLYEVRWDADGTPDGPPPDGRWLAVAAPGGSAEALAARLGGVEVISPDGLAAALRSPARGVIDLRALDAGDDPLPLCTDVLAGFGQASDPRYWVVTRGTQATGHDTRAVDPAQAAVWGLGRSLALEHPERWGGLVDLDPEASAETSAAALLAEVGRAAGNDQVAFRGGRRFVPRLVRKAATDTPGTLKLRPEGTYLVTGGLGELGLLVAGRLVERGARRLVLVGRRGLPDRDRWDGLPGDHPDRVRVDTVLALEAMGASVTVAAADVGDPDALAALLDGLRRTLPPVRGVVHAAGVVRGASEGQTDADSLAAVLRPKAAGALELDRLTRHLPLDFFVLFSSVASVWGVRKSADYAAANAVLDALAHRRAAAGLPALSVNWGPWGGGGMAVASGWQRSFRLMGIAPLDPTDGLDLFDRLLAAAGTPQVTAAAVDWTAFGSLHGLGGRSTFLDALTTPAAGSNGHAAGRPGADRLRALEPAHRREALVALVRDRVAGVLRLPADRLDPERPLGTLGLDSLMAMELKADVEAETGAAVPLSVLLEGPSVVELAESLVDALDAGAPAPLPVPTPGEAGPASPSLTQQALWYAHQLAPTGEGYNIAGAARVLSSIDLAAFRRAVRRLAARHDALRATFPSRDGRPALHVDAEPADLLTAEDASGWTDYQLGRRLDDEANRPFDLERGPLLRVFLWSRGERDHVVLLVAHHIIADFWTTTVLLDEFGRAYAAESAGTGPDLGPEPLAFADYVRWQNALLAGPEGERLWSYWQTRLTPPPADLDLPGDRPRPPVRSQRGAVRHAAFDPGLTRDLVDLAASRGVSLYTLLLAGFQALLGRLSGQDDVTVGSPVAGRTRPGLEGLVGYVVNLVPMRADLSGDPTFEELLARTRRAVHDGLEHQDYPYPLMIQRLRPPTDPGRTPLFQVLFIHQKAQRPDAEGLTPFALNAPGYRMDLGGLALESLPVHTGGAPFDLTLMTALSGDRLALMLEFSTDLFEPDTAGRLLDRLRALLAGAAADPSRRLGDLPLLDAPALARVLDDWGRGPALAPAGPACVHDLFAARARLTPDAEAVVFGDDRLTYGALDAASNRLAHHLRALGVTPGTLVGLHCGRSPRLMVALLGVLKAGGAYVPLDPALPTTRLAQMAADAGVAFVVTDGEAPPPGAGPFVDLRADAALIAARPDTDPGPAATPDHPAYVIYTSGSTGTPKGVVVAHRSLVHAYRAWEQAYGLAGWTGRHLQIAGVAFDVFTGDWTRALCSGGALVSCPREALLDPQTLYDLMTRERVDCAEFVPAGVEGLIGLCEATGQTLGFMRLIAVGSDLMYAGQYERLRRVAGPGVRVVNSYGLTEATVDSTFFEGDLADAPPGRAVPVGRPFPGTRVYVLDGRLRPVPAGVTGELFVGGPGVALGYLNRPGLTADRFVPDPFAGRPGARLYRTGDVARWQADGTLELLGRSDRQVKVRGYRIELGEIESALLRHPAVTDAAVVVREGPGGERRLAAYAVAGGHLPPPDATELRRWLKQGLPEYMVPSTIGLLDALPLSTNGKVDRRALAALEPPPAPAVTDAEAPGAAPGTPAEALLARTAAAVLGVASVGVHDNLFDLGLDSIQVLQIVARARESGLRLDPALLFRAPTVAEIAAGAVTLEPAAPPAPAVDLLAGFDREALARALDGAPAVDDVYPLTPVQEGMLFHTLHEPESGAYVEQFTCRLRGALDADALDAAWRLVVARHPALRTAVLWAEPDRAVQAVFNDVTLPAARHDWSDAAPTEQARRFASLLADDRRQGFVPTWAPLSRLTLVRLGPEEHRLVWTAHHLVFDGWCLPVVLGEVLAAYDAARRGEAPALPPAPAYRDYVAWLRRQDGAAAEAFWRSNLAGFRTPTALGIDRSASSHAGAPFDEVEALVDPDTAASLAALARAERLTLGTVLQGAWALLLSRYAGTADVVFGVAVAGRPADLPGAEGMVGVLIQVLPLRAAVDESQPVVPWLRGVQDRLVAARRFESTPPVTLHACSDVPRGRPLFETLLVVQNTPVDPALLPAAGALGVEEPRVYEQTSYPLTVTVLPESAGLRLRLGFDARRFDPDAVGRLAGHLTTILQGIAAHPGRRLADLPMLTPAEQAGLTHPWGGPHDAPGPDPLAGLDPGDLDALSEAELDAYLAAIQDPNETEPEAPR